MKMRAFFRKIKIGIVNILVLFLYLLIIKRFIWTNDSRSDTNKIFWIFISILILIIFFKISSIYRDRRQIKSVTKFKRGTQSERQLVLTLLKYGIPAKDVFHDLYVQNSSGRYTQIDLAVITKVGIVVFEVKDYSGWIYGNGRHEQWTKVLAYGKEKYRFYNPIKQNNKHVENLRKLLYQLHVPIFSIVVFYGDCVLKDIRFIPRGTYLAKSNRVIDVLKVILKNNEPALYINEDNVYTLLKDAVSNGSNVEIQKQHIENIKDMLGEHRIFN